jgi:hypothetical protein
VLQEYIFITGFAKQWCSGEIDPMFTWFTDEEGFDLSGHVNTENNRYWLAENPRRIREVPLYKIKVGVWCAISTTRIIRPNIEQSVNFFQNLSDEKEYAFF